MGHYSPASAGFDLGFERAGIETKWQVEHDPFCVRVLERHWPRVARFHDVREWACNRDEHAVDVVTAGFPCTDLSVAGKRAGLGGKQSGLFWHVVRVASALRPEWLVLENVPGICSSCSCRGCRVCDRFLRLHRSRGCRSCPGCIAATESKKAHKGADLAVVCAALAELGLAVVWRIMDSQFFGVAQRRRRVFVVCHADAGRAAAVLFEPEGGAGNTAALREARVDVAYCLEARSHGIGRVRLDADTETFVAHTLRGEGHDASEDGTGRGTPLVAVPAEQSAPQPGRTVRRLTPLECMRLQAFPDHWCCTPGPTGPLDLCPVCQNGPDAPRYRAIGNAVTVNVAYWLATRIIKQ